MTNSTSPAGKGPRRDPSKETFWRRTLQEQVASGQDVRAFCAARGLSEPSFYCWRRTVGQRDRKGTAPRARGTSQRPTFVELRPQPLSPAPVSQTDAPLEVVVGDRRVLIRRGCDRALLREVLAALGE